MKDLFGDERRISEQAVQNIRLRSPRRRQIKEHKVVDFSKKLVRFPFYESIGFLFEYETGLTLIDKSYKYLSKTEFDDATEWEMQRLNYVFIRDCLDCSIALDFNFTGLPSSPENYTQLGRWEHSAKRGESVAACYEISQKMADAVDDLSPYRTADAICAVPASTSRSFCVPTTIVHHLHKSLGSDKLMVEARFRSKDVSIKSTPLESRWSVLDKSGFELTTDVAGKEIILVDDKYQSGTTAQFVGSKLLEAGAKKVYGLFVVKTLRDTDNT